MRARELVELTEHEYVPDKTLDRAAKVLVSQSLTEHPGWWVAALEQLINHGHDKSVYPLVTNIAARNHIRDHRDPMFKALIAPVTAQLLKLKADYDGTQPPVYEEEVLTGPQAAMVARRIVNSSKREYAARWKKCYDHHAMYPQHVFPFFELFNFILRKYGVDSDSPVGQEIQKLVLK